MLVKVEEGVDCIDLFDMLDDFLDESSFILMNNEVGGERSVRKMGVLVGGEMDDGISF